MQVKSYTFFQGTQYPLRVTWVFGDEPGPTIMVQGGIQGDELSGFCTAQMLTHCNLRKGNLIIVPRANEPSILRRTRQINVDLNRRFDKEYNSFYEDRLARAIRFLINGADGFIHLHEGSGFYNPVYVDKLRNPNRYGQSLIIDAAVYKGLHLERMCLQTIDRLNKDIANPSYRFTLFNTDTFDKTTHYPEMLKSLTCYALVTRGIPAMAVEVSKDIKNLEWKVRKQLKATVYLLEEFGLKVDEPDFSFPKSSSSAGLEIKINGHLLKGRSIDLVRGGPVYTAGSDRAEACSVLEPSLAVFASDRPNLNMLTAPRMALSTFPALEVRLDGDRMASAKVRWQGTGSDLPEPNGPVFLCWLNGNPRFVNEKGTLKAVDGDQLILEGVLGSSAEEILNLKGFVASVTSNNGQDVGYEIIADPSNFMAKYMLDEKDGVSRYRIVRETPGKRRAEFYLSIEPRRVKALELVPDHGDRMFLNWVVDGVQETPADHYVLKDVWSNGGQNKIQPFVNGIPANWGETFEVGSGRDTTVTLRHATTFDLIGSMTIRGRNYMRTSLD
ncbi:M99 family carboxypeptidase catalytic domain-containing protein [Maridesulfovibrio sp.]|uniref:M99 family carboxypeptidase catalytic domain-containing protein n=1 Tax=Maridesulfovibrio sp. TaxID=2795000 RepID=UPI002A1887DB|nr:M99 family carboxypeptidase catalytic domain-containing protein [Maridesulfovibrio sp.]